MKKPDLPIGKQFKQLTILSKSTKIGSNKKSYYICMCDCGAQTVVSRSDLVTKNVKSCGCRRRLMPSLTFKLEPGEVSYRALYKRCTHGAIVRDIPLTLTSIQHRAIIKENCYYCNSPPVPYNCYSSRKNSNMTTKSVKDAWIIANGIDRIDSNLGYSIENSVACCSACNYGKNDYPAQEFIAWCRRVVAFQDVKCNRI